MRSETKPKPSKKDLMDHGKKSLAVHGHAHKIAGTGAGKKGK